MVGGLRQPSLNILDELLSEAGSRPGTALTDSSWRPGTASFRGIARCASALSSKAKSLKSRSRSTIPGREELPPNLMRLKKGLYVELHWLLRQLSGVEASQLSCAELMSSPVEEEEEDDLLTAVQEEETPVKRMSTVAERRAAAEEPGGAWTPSSGNNGKVQSSRVLPATASCWRRSSIPWNAYRHLSLLLLDLKRRRTSTGAVRIPCSMRVGATFRSRKYEH